MRKKIAIGLCFVSPAVLFVLWQRSAGAQDSPPHFSISVTETAQEIEMKCQAGCAWQKLSYSCDGEVPCSAVVDERGVRGAPAPAGK